METKTNSYFKELPENYQPDFTIDVKEKKTRITINVMFFSLLVLSFVICEGFNRFNFSFEFELITFLLTPIIFAIAYVIMIILHELIHGLFCVILTHEKLILGFTKGAAYCGTPDIYIKKGPKIVIALAPFTTILIVLIVALIFIKHPYYYMIVSIFLGLHIGGCSGDLYETFILLFKYHGKKVLVNDVGPKQVIYIEKLESII